jgi:hypothetical protein
MSSSSGIFLSGFDMLAEGRKAVQGGLRLQAAGKSGRKA